MRKILSFVFLLVLAQPTLAGKHAFVLSNADYDELLDLNNTHADAEAYVEAFEGFDYQVTHHKDLTRKDTEQALDLFLNRVRPGDQVVFVYAGHGWSDGQVNYFVPTDTPRKASTRILKRQSFAIRNGVTGLLDELEAIGVSLTVAIIDACRDNPFEPQQGSRSIGLSRGLARVNASEGTFVVFSAGEGQQALDGLPDDPPDQKLSVFTRVFIPHLISGVTLEDAISAAQKETAQLALRSNGHKQHPAYYDQTLGDTCLKGDCLPATQVALQPKNEVCNALYQEAKSEKACFAYKAYAKSCADHIFAPVAQSFLEDSCAEPEKKSVKIVDEGTNPDTQQTRELVTKFQAEESEEALGLSRSKRKEIQQRLTLLDFKPGGADGIFGNRTRNAISSWQTASGIQATGYLDSDQIKKLNTQSDAEYAEFIAAQRSRQKNAPKNAPKPVQSKKKAQPTKTDLNTNRKFTCRTFLTTGKKAMRISSTKRTVNLAREDVMATCKSRGAGVYCTADRIFCEETTNR